MTVRTRFAPSPTGYLHIGGVWAALFAWMHARRHGGQFILRIEDTDTKRTVDGALEDLMDGLRWFGLDWDEGPDVGGEYGPYIQTQRKAIYQKWADWLVDNGHAYKCFATSEELKAMREAGVPFGYDRRYRECSAETVDKLIAEGKPYVIRQKMPLSGQTIVPDLLRGDVVFDNEQFADYVLLKSNGLPTYHLAVVVDDHLMKISHITRGVEWLNTAPVHVNLYKAFGWEMPVFVHLPSILNPNGKGKLSKRTQAFDNSGSKVLVRADEFQAAGYLPETLLNFLSMIGWTYGDDIEKYTMAEAFERFDLADASTAPTRLPYSKLDWLNGQYIQEMEPQALAVAVTPFLEAEGYTVDMQKLLPVMPAMRVRLKKFSDAPDFLRFLFDAEAWSPDITKVRHSKIEDTKGAYERASVAVAAMEPYTLETIEAGLRELGRDVTSNNREGPFLGKLRYAITGQKVSPPLFESMIGLGRDEVVRRLDAVAERVTE